jgi:hypothetical protein
VHSDMHCHEMRRRWHNISSLFATYFILCCRLLTGSYSLEYIICFACSENSWKCFHIGQHKHPPTPPHWPVSISVTRNKEEGNKGLDAESDSLTVPPTCSTPNT